MYCTAQDLALDIQAYQARCFEEQQRGFDGKKKRHSLGF